jgi:hypothetical protein
VESGKWPSGEVIFLLSGAACICGEVKGQFITAMFEALIPDKHGEVINGTVQVIQEAGYS